MAGSAKRGGGERVLESRHLVGLFLGVVLLCGVFFTLGYVMGRNQFGGSVHAESTTKNTASSSPKSKPADAPAATTDWDFYDKNKDTTHLEPPASAVKSPPVSSASPKPAAPTPSAAKPYSNDARNLRLQPQATPKSGIVLQIAATRSQADALEMAEAVQQKKFPCFIVTPSSDNLYRVQVGPYQDIASAEAAKRSLEQLGFKNIFRR
jgi:DedD protein